MLDNRTFKYLKPTEAQAGAMEELRQQAADYAANIEALVAPSADRTYALRKLREVAMWINVAITRNDDGSPRDDSATTGPGLG